MALLTEIEQQAKIYAQTRTHLAEIVTALHDGMEALKRSHMVRLKNAVNRAAEANGSLHALIEASPDLFLKPRSLTLHGIKLGFAKGKGKIEWDDPDQVVKLIKRHYPDLADVLITTTEKPAKEALNNLTAAELKKIGVSVTEGGDAVFIRPADSDVDKMVDALLKGATEEVAA